MNRDRKNPLKKKRLFSVAEKTKMKKKNMRPDVPYILCAGRFFALSFFFLGTKRRNLKGPFLLVIRSAAPAPATPPQ